ncbi:putative ribonuclease H-like domain-containing protein [Tanacetum coccineum]
MGKRLSITKWVFRNKKDERGIVIRNKARLVVQGRRQEEGIDYKEVFALVARIEAIRLFLAYASFMGFLVYQMDVKSAFLYGTIEEEVYVTQPPGSKYPNHPDKVYKVVKALYGLHQVPRACRRKKNISPSEIKYVAETLKKFNYTDVKAASTPVDLEKPLVKDRDADDVDVHLYRSMIGYWEKPGRNLAVQRSKLWFQPLQQKDEYVAAASCGQHMGLLCVVCGGWWWLGMGSSYKGFDAEVHTWSRKHVKRGRDTKIPQSSGPPVKVGDEAVHKELGDRIERAATTTSSLEAEHYLVLPVQVPAAEAKANTVNGEHRLQALVDKKRVIIIKSSIRSNLHLEDAGGIDCLPTAAIFEELAWMGHPLLPNHHPLDHRRSSLGGILAEEIEVLNLEKANDAQAKEIAGLKKRGRLDDAEMFDIDDLHDDEVIVDMAVGEKQEKSAKIDEREVSTGIEDSVALTIPVTTADEGVTAAKIDEITPTTKPKVVTTAATTTTIRPKARGVVVQEPSEFKTTTSSPQASQPLKTKDKGKAIMIEPEVPLKRKDQVALDEEMVRNLEAQLQAELIEEEKIARKRKKKPT